MKNILDDLNKLIGNEGMSVDDIFAQIAPNYPGLTKTELISEAINGNFSCMRINNGPEMLRKKPERPVPIPPNQNPNFHAKTIRIPFPPNKKR